MRLLPTLVITLCLSELLIGSRRLAEAAPTAASPSSQELVTEIQSGLDSTASDQQGGATVRLVRSQAAWSMQVNGQPFVVHGAGMSYSDETGIASLAKAGGNAFRTWGTEHLNAQLAAAARHGLMVLVGLDVQKELQGFNYQDSEAVAQQLTRVKASIDRYRGHPNVLGWILANEPNLMIDGRGAAVPADPAVYDALGEILDYIQLQEAAKPVTVAFAFTATLAEDIAQAMKAMPSLDFLSFQAYGALPIIAEFVQDQDIELPYMVTEYGPLGHWEMPTTAWGREIEEPSGIKATGLVERMARAGLDDPAGQLLGGFAFLWGHKQERTPTWYGLFTEDGERTAAVDELTRVWTGQYPTLRAPSIWSITLNGQQAGASVSVASGDTVSATVHANDPNGDALTIRWQVMNEVGRRSHGGHFEARPELLHTVFSHATEHEGRFSVSFVVPEKPGHYRLYAWASDAQGGAGTANVPFLVTAQ